MVLPDFSSATIFTVTSFFFSVAAAFRLLTHRREPSSTLAWLFACIFIPIAGPLLFFVFGSQRLKRSASRRKQRLGPTEALAEDTRAQAELERLTETGGHNVLELARQVSDYAATARNVVDILPDPAQTLKEMQAAIQGARSFVHLEYYIIASDEVTKQLFGSLIEARARGVEVRILYDSIGSLFLKRRTFRELVNQGAKVSGFLPLSGIFLRLNPNFRNHRKILIVDGMTAFTGGTNIGRQYLGLRNDHQWRDFTVRLRGPVVNQMQDVFRKDWQFATREHLSDARYYPESPGAGEHLIQMVESGPDTEFRTFHQALFLAINSAQKQILLTTPYFVPDGAISTALVVAALRGVEVKLLLPYKNDSWVVRHASRSFYESMLRAGVQIYEYEPTILHAKMMVLDGKWSVFGSGNMDIRSFRLNFELNLFVYGAAVAQEAQQSFSNDIDQSKQVDFELFLKRPLITQMVENFCRLFSPML